MHPSLVRRTVAGRLLWGLAYADNALDFLETLTPKLRKQIVNKINALYMNPNTVGTLQLRGVETDGGEPIRRERSGDYRILYVVRDNPAQLVVLDIDHRKDVYR